MKVDEEFHSVIYSQALRMAEKVGTQPVKPRVTGRQPHRSNVITETICEHYTKNVAIPFLDHINQDLESQFSGLAKKAASLLGLVPTIICGDPAMVDIDGAVELYNGDLPSPEILPQELKRWKARYDQMQEEDRPSSPVAAMKDCNEMYFPNIYTLLKIACTIPVTSCECERSASTIRRLHSYLRATMGQERLSSLA